MQLKKLIKQDALHGAVCCMDAYKTTAQHKAWFSARYLWRMGIPVVCYSLEEYDETEWKMLKRRFPELDEEVPYFVLSYQDDQADFILSALSEQTAAKEKRLRKEGRIWNKFTRTVKDRFAL